MCYHEVRNYGFNHIIRRYSGFPWYLPLPAHMEHGWTPYDFALKTDLKSDKPLMLVFNRRREKIWKKESSMHVAIMGSPFIHYKNAKRLNKSPNASGTIAFPSHSIYEGESRFSVEKYCRLLNDLPAEFKPIKICLFYLDYISPRAQIYKNAGFEVVTAGPKFTGSLDFANRFYRHLLSCRYATSNSVGSYAFYAIDLDIPFFLWGDKPKLVDNKKDINISKRKRRGESKLSRIARAIFSTGPSKTISRRQKDFVAEQMGVDACLTQEELHILLKKTYKSNRYFRYIPVHLWSCALNKIIFDAPWTGWLVRLRAKWGKRAK